MVTPVQYAGAVTVHKRIAQANIAVQEGGVEEVKEFGSIVGKFRNLKGIHRLWAHPQDGPVLKVPGESFIGSV